MAPHLNDRELDLVRRWSAAMTPSQIQAKLAAQREKKGIEPVGDAAIRRAVRAQLKYNRFCSCASLFISYGRAGGPARVQTQCESCFKCLLRELPSLLAVRICI